MKNGEKTNDLICKMKSGKYTLRFINREKNISTIMKLGLTRNDAIDWIIKNLNANNCLEGPLTDQNLSQGEVYIFKYFCTCVNKILYIKLILDKEIVNIISFHFDE